jgi:hypothetical protein
MGTCFLNLRVEGQENESTSWSRQVTEAASMLAGGDIDMVILGLGIESKEGGGGFVASDRAKVAKQLSRLVRLPRQSHPQSRLAQHLSQPIAVSLLQAASPGHALSAYQPLCFQARSSAPRISSPRSARSERPATAPSLQNWQL